MLRFVHDDFVGVKFVCVRFNENNRCAANDRLAQRLRASIVKSLRTSGAFEVIDIQPHELGPCKTTVIRNGNYDERQLNWLMKNHSVDAVMFSRLNHARTVAPPIMHRHLPYCRRARSIHHCNRRGCVGPF